MVHADILQQFLDRLEAGQLDECIPLMQQLWSVSNIPSPIWVKIGDVYRKKSLEVESSQSKTEYARKALEAFQRATAIDPKNSTAWLRLGHFYLYFLDAFDAAIQAFKQVGVNFKSNWQFNTALGQAHMAKNTPADLEAAIQYFKWAHELAPSEFDPLYFGALAIYEYNLKTLEQDPSFHPNFDYALELMDRAHDQYPEEYAATEEFDNIKKDALRLYTQILETNDNDAETWYHLGLLKYLEAEYADAIMAFCNATELQQDMYDAWYYLGRSYYYGPHDYEKAKIALQKCVEYDPNYVDAWICLGDIATENDDPENAQSNYLKVLKLDPANELARSGLNQLSKKTKTQEPSSERPKNQNDIAPKRYPKIILAIKKADEYNIGEPEIEVIAEDDPHNPIPNTLLEQLLASLEPSIQQLIRKHEFQNCAIPIELQFDMNILPTTSTGEHPIIHKPHPPGFIHKRTINGLFEKIDKTEVGENSPTESETQNTPPTEKKTTDEQWIAKIRPRLRLSFEKWEKK
jgi:cytochrome c-type biogenesis protein CcmH/NrfG